MNTYKVYFILCVLKEGGVGGVVVGRGEVSCGPVGKGAVAVIILNHEIY